LPDILLLIAFVGAIAVLFLTVDRAYKLGITYDADEPKQEHPHHTGPLTREELKGQYYGYQVLDVHEDKLPSGFKFLQYHVVADPDASVATHRDIVRDIAGSNEQLAGATGVFAINFYEAEKNYQPEAWDYYAKATVDKDGEYQLAFRRGLVSFEVYRGDLTP
jgi:hypothetical protein